MAQRSFSASVSAWVRKSEARLEAVFKGSAQDVISLMQEPGPSVANPDGFGTGHMPIDTGFLRASLMAAINDPVPSIVFRPPDLTSAAYDPSPIALVIAGAKLGETIYATYSADYARAMEARYGFVRLAAQKWPEIVSRNAQLARQRVEGR